MTAGVHQRGCCSAQSRVSKPTTPKEEAEERWMEGSFVSWWAIWLLQKREPWCWVSIIPHSSLLGRSRIHNLWPSTSRSAVPTLPRHTHPPLQWILGVGSFPPPTAVVHEKVDLREAHSAAVKRQWLFWKTVTPDHRGCKPRLLPRNGD